jgi:hypothetical protein
MELADLNHQTLSELSAFVASARKEGFSFKPSQIVRDAAYCKSLIDTVASRGSTALVKSARNIVGKYHKSETISAA